MDTLGNSDNEMYFGLYLCIRGECEMVVNDRLCRICAGDAFVKSPLVQIGNMRKSTDFEFVSIFNDGIDLLAPIAEKSFDVVQESLRQNKFYCTCDVHEQGIFLEKKRLLERYKSELESLEISSKQYMLVKHIVALTEQTAILEYARVFIRQQESILQDNEKERSVMVKFIFQLFREYAQSRQVGYYADKQNLSPNHFTRIIKKVSHRTPSEWIAIVTINQAKKLLQQNGLTIKEVAQKLNFPEQFTFRKYFKLYVGISPKEYRAKFM